MAVKQDEAASLSQRKLAAVLKNVTSLIRGKDEAVELALVALLAGGHVLIEDVPGVGKTMLALALAHSIKCPFRRIQFTNDTVPADILGMMVYSRKDETFRFVQGPIFAGVVLADEINRSSPKTQSALLEAMTERKVSIENRVFDLPEPFMVIATQNPTEFHGTFPLPESQLDRFLLRLRIGYPNRQAEREILQRDIGPDSIAELPEVIDQAEVLAARAEAAQVRIDDSLLDYILDLAARTREDDRLSVGVSPRGTLMLKRAAQALAFLRGRGYALPDDVKALAGPVWAHRVSPAGGAHAHGAAEEAEAIMADILERTPLAV